MARSEPVSFERYLEVKRALDDRSLNRHVWNRLLEALPPCAPSAPMNILDVGAGLGSMLERLVAWGLSGDLRYCLLERDPQLVARMGCHLRSWAHSQGWRINTGASGELVFRGAERTVVCELLCADLFDAGWHLGRRWDLVVSHAFLDLVDVASALPLLFSLLQADGLYYFTLVFDGDTIFRPLIDETLDRRVATLYHASMDRGGSSAATGGRSQTGRRLLELLVEARAPILGAGSSDWLVHPPYGPGEPYFLRHILHFVETALQGCSAGERERLDAWLELRRRHIAEERLVYIAHQIDVVGRPPVC